MIAGASLFIPDPNLVFNPERTLSAVLAHIHYFPSTGPGGSAAATGWKGREHTPQVMEALGELFPYTAIFLLHELLSPIVTPFVLMFVLRPKGETLGWLKKCKSSMRVP